MPLSYVVENIETIPEAQRELYTKSEDGKFRLQLEGTPEGYVAEAEIVGLKSALEKERTTNKEFAKKVKSIDGLNIEELRALKDRLDKDEDLQLIQAGKHDDVFNRRTEKLRADHATQLKALEDKHVGELDTANKKALKFERKVIENSIRAATTEVPDIHQTSGVHRDILAQATALFSLDDDGNVIQRREDGSIIIGKDGKTPFGPKDWLESRRDDSSHWFKASGSGTNAAQSGRNAQGKKTMTRAAFQQLPASEQREFVRTQGGLVVD